MRAIAKQPAGPSAPRARADGTLDPESQAWVQRLSTDGPERERAASELHALLLKAARFALRGRPSLLSRLGRERVEELAVEAADDALVSILARLDDFRGESRFTTWAWKFAFLEACVAARRQRWAGREVPLEADGWLALDREAGPEGRAEHAELLATVKRGVEEELTPHQRSVFVALALNQVPVDVLAERLGTTRGALYKTLHDARGRLRAYLAAAGLRPDGR